MESLRSRVTRSCKEEMKTASIHDDDQQGRKERGAEALLLR